MASRVRVWMLLLAIGATPAAAAPMGAVDGEAQGRATGRGHQGARGALAPSDIQDQFDAYAIVQAQDALKLSDEQFPHFVRRARELQALRRRERVERARLMGDLTQALRARDASDARLAAATRALDEHERASLDRLQRAYAAVDDLLDVRQRARFRVLEEQLERKKLDMLFRARQAPRR